MRWLPVLLMVACVAEPEAPERDPVEQAIQDWRELKAQLDQSIVLVQESPGFAYTIIGREGRLHQANLSGGSTPDVTSLDVATGAWTECGDIVGATQWNWEGSGTHIAHADPGSFGEIHVYEVANSCAEVAAFELPAAPGLGYWPYAMEGDVFYWLDDEDGHTLYRREGANDVVVSRMADLGLTASQVSAFQIQDGRVAVYTGIEVHYVDLNAGTAAFTGHDVQVEWDSMRLTQHGILFEDRDDVLWYDTDEGRLRNLSEELAFAPYAVSTVWQSAHLPTSGAAALGRTVLYNGDKGVFAYDLDSGAIEPLALDAYDADQGYFGPVVAGDTLFVEGSVDNDRRLHRVDNRLVDAGHAW